MNTRGATRGWATTEAQRATFIELFFDLVFVFAVTSITGLLLEDLSWSGVGHGALILWLVWWAWTQFTWTLNPADTDHRAVRLLTLGATGAAFFMAQSIPDAFTTAGPWFAVSYAVVRVLGLGLQHRLDAGTSGNVKAVTSWMSGSAVGIGAVVAGGFLGSPWRDLLWGGAVLVDLISAALAGRGSWRIHAAHFAERHGLIVIIALGESLIAAGLALRHLSRDAAFAAGTVVAVVAISALWWIYFGRAKDELEAHLASRTPDEVGREARNIYSWGHLPIIAGIIAFAVSIEHVLSHPSSPLGPEVLIALTSGTVLYFGGIGYGLLRIPGHRLLPWGLAAAAAVVVAVLAAVSNLNGLIALTGVTLVLVAFAAWVTLSSAAATKG